MDSTQKGIEALKDEIKTEIRAIFNMNMKFEGWNVPEVDDTEATKEILDIMQEALDELKSEYC